jgi:serine/threonine protein kinase
MSPESLVNNMYSKKGDAFAFGVFLYYLATRRFPWKGKDKHELIEHYEKRRASQRPLHLLPPKLKHYINGLLERNMELRLSIFDIDIEIFPRVRDASNI